MRDDRICIHGYNELIVGQKLFQHMWLDPGSVMIHHVMSLIVMIVITVNHGIQIVICDRMRYKSAAVGLKRFPVDFGLRM